MSRRQDNNEDRKKLMSRIKVLLLEYGAVAQMSIIRAPEYFSLGLV